MNAEKVSVELCVLIFYVWNVAVNIGVEIDWGKSLFMILVLCMKYDSYAPRAFTLWTHYNVTTVQCTFIWMYEILALHP